MWTLLMIIIIIVVAFLTALQLKNWFRAVCLALKLPGPPAVPFFGNILLLKNETDFIRSVRDLHKEYEGSLVRWWVTLTPFITVSDPKHIQIILASTKQTDKSFLYTFMHTFLGEGLLTTSGNKWKSHRKLIQPFFNLNKLELFISAFTESSQLLVEELKNKEEVQITRPVNTCVLNILHQAFMGIPAQDSRTKEASPFDKGHFLVLERIINPLYMVEYMYKFTNVSKTELRQQLTLQEFAKQILDLRRKSAHKSEWCLLDAFIEISEHNPQFTDENIVDEICTFMLAGQDSVSAAISFTLYNLAKHPDVQDRVVQELEAVFEHRSEINLECLNDMAYLEQCIKESLRLFPSVPLFSRKLAEDIRLGEHTLPAGLNIFLSPMGTHRLEEHYPDPEKFDPERFSPENEKKLHPYAFIPFSAGPRNCIGYKFAYWEMKTIIATVLRRYVLMVPPDYHLKVAFRVTLRSRGGIKLQLKPRE